MVSWDCVPEPPEIIGPWFLWKLIIDERHQHRGCGREVVAMVADLVREAAADYLLTSYFLVPTGDVDDNGEIILRLDLRGAAVRRLHGSRTRIGPR